MANALGVNYDVSGIAKLDTGTAEGKAIKELSDSYMMLLKRLRYMSTNLGVENFNEVELDKIKSDLIVSLQDDIQGISTEFSVTSGQILAKVEGALGDYVSTSQLEMTLNGLSLSVSNNAGGYSTISLKSGSTVIATSGHITLGGSVVFTSDLTDGVTTISGSNITTGTINANNVSITNLDASNIKTGTLDASLICLKGLLGVYTGSTLRGYLGGYSGSDIHGATNGAIMAAANTGDTGYVAVSSGGARMGYGAKAQVICTTTVHFVVEDNNGNSETRALIGAASLRPNSNGRLDLGASGTRWDYVYLVHSPDVSSDKRTKNSISYDLDEYEILFDHLSPAKYKVNMDDGNRYHTGFIAQDIEEGLTASGLSVKDFAGFKKTPCYAKENEDGMPDTSSEIVDYEYSLCYEEFIALAVMKIKKLEARIEALEG